ncbi:MAG: GxxExxY protein [Planctomycetaceae bacterium]
MISDRQTANHEGTKGTKMNRYEPVSAECEEVSRQVIDSAMKVHRTLGPGLLESVYEQCRHHELKTRGLSARRQVPVPVIYDGVTIESGLKLDLLVSDLVIVELKAVELMIPLYEAQLLTYLKLAHRQVGLLINFNVPLLKHGIKRVILTLVLPS